MFDRSSLHESSIQFENEFDFIALDDLSKVSY